MRLWSLHPRYLDAKGLVALWREGLLARAVLSHRTRGYTHHPQLARFQACANPVAAMDCYLRSVHEESVRRGYRFDARKLRTQRRCLKIRVSAGQIRYEWNHLQSKLKRRAPDQFQANQGVLAPRPHPFFKQVASDIEAWERLPRTKR